MFLKETNGKGHIRTLKEQTLDEKRQMQMKEMNSEFAEGDLMYFKTGMSVNHKNLGAGIVVSTTLFFVNVHFESGNKMFPLT